MTLGGRAQAAAAAGEVTCGRACSTIAAKASGSAIAISLSILRLSRIPAASSAGMKRL